MKDNVSKRAHKTEEVNHKPSKPNISLLDFSTPPLSTSTMMVAYFVCTIWPSKNCARLYPAELCCCRTEDNGCHPFFSMEAFCKVTREFWKSSPWAGYGGLQFHHGGNPTEN